MPTRTSLCNDKQVSVTKLFELYRDDASDIEKQYGSHPIPTDPAYHTNLQSLKHFISLNLPLESYTGFSSVKLPFAHLAIENAKKAMTMTHITGPGSLALCALVRDQLALYCSGVVMSSVAIIHNNLYTPERLEEFKWKLSEMNRVIQQATVQVAGSVTEQAPEAPPEGLEKQVMPQPQATAEILNVSKIEAEQLAQAHSSELLDYKIGLYPSIVAWAYNEHHAESMPSEEKPFEPDDEQIIKTYHVISFV